MKITLRLHTLALLLVGLCACGTPDPQTDPELPMVRPEDVSAEVNQWLSDATELQIYSLNPRPSSMEDKELASREHFHDYAILGHATIRDRKRAREILNLVYRGIHESDGTVAACFDPRHGIRATSGERTVDFVICYECLSMHIHHGTQQESATTTRGPQVEMDAIWKQAGLSLVPRH